MNLLSFLANPRQIAFLKNQTDTFDSKGVFDFFSNAGFDIFRSDGLLVFSRMLV